MEPRDVLDAETARAIAHIEALTAEFDDIVAGTTDSNSDDEHDPEGPTLAFERGEGCRVLLSQGRAYLVELEDAGQRVLDGTYGCCTRCGAALAPERLATRPAARTCVQCAPHRGWSKSQW